jgi:hypothetical protein
VIRVIKNLEVQLKEFEKKLKKKINLVKGKKLKKE